MTGNAFVLILAGGGGTRLWPASRKKRPKQFLPLLPGGQTLLGATVERVRAIAPPERILVVTSSRQVDEVRRCAPSVPVENIVIEPEARNTAACIGLGALEVQRRDPRGLVAVIPSDQHVARPEPYAQALARALEAAQAGAIVTVGIRPTAPETGFGYIEPGAEQAVPGTGRTPVFVVQRFVEKPDRATAEKYLAAGYLWNSGMFFFQAGRMLEAIGRHLPPLGELLDQIGREPARAGELYPKAPAISIDFGVMEKLGRGEVQVVPGDFGWNDVGSWSALAALAPADEAGNHVLGASVTVDAHENLLYPEGKRLVAAVGVRDLVIVATDEAVLVLPRERAQEVREIVRALETSKRDSYL